MPALEVDGCWRSELTPRLAATIALLLRIRWVVTFVMMCPNRHGSAIVAFERQDNDTRGVATGASKNFRHDFANRKSDAGCAYSRNARVFSRPGLSTEAPILKGGRSSISIENGSTSAHLCRTPRDVDPLPTGGSANHVSNGPAARPSQRSAVRSSAPCAMERWRRDRGSSSLHVVVSRAMSISSPPELGGTLQ